MELFLNVLFWVLTLGIGTIWSGCFIVGNYEYDEDTLFHGKYLIDITLWLFGFLGVGVPVLQVGLWLHYSTLMAWNIVLVMTALTSFIVVWANWPESK